MLNVLLKTAVEWKVINQMPCAVRMLPVPKTSASFHDFGVFERLVDTARETDWQTHLIVLLGGEAGLRCGEMLALEWPDVNLKTRQLCVRRSDWEGHITVPKGGRQRYVSLTIRLARGAASVSAPEQPAGALPARWQPAYPEDGAELDAPCDATGRITNNGVHVLKHTFCSHLAMRGAPARAIQELAGHQDLSTTSGICI